jgi:actin-related protein
MDELENKPEGTPGGSSLLDDLLKQTRIEAEREKEKLEKKLKDRADETRRKKEEEESRKRAELKMRLEEETRRRQELIKKKKGDVETQLQAQVAEERQQVIAQAAVAKSQVAQIVTRVPVLPVLLPLAALLLVVGGLAVFQYLYVAGLPGGMRGFGEMLSLGVEQAYAEARVKEQELKTLQIQNQVTGGNRSLLDLRKQVEDLTAQVAAREAQIKELQAAQGAAKGNGGGGAGGGQKKTDDGMIKINTNIFKTGKGTR